MKQYPPPLSRLNATCDVPQPLHPHTLSFRAEVTYDDALHGQLVDTIAILLGVPCDPAPDPRVRIAEAETGLSRSRRALLGIPLRDGDAGIVEVARTRGFDAMQVCLRPPCSEHSSPVAIYEFLPPAFYNFLPETNREVGPAR